MSGDEASSTPKPGPAEGPLSPAATPLPPPPLGVPRSATPATVAPAHHDQLWSGAWTVRTLNLTYDALDPTASPRYDVIYITAAVPLVGPLTMRKVAATPQVTWSLPTAGAAPALVTPASSGSAVWVVNMPATASQVASSPSAGSAASSPSAASSASSASSGAPLASATSVPSSGAPLSSASPMPSGGVADLLARVPADLGARPYRLLRLLCRGASWMALFTFRTRDRLDQETRRRIYTYLMEHPGALAGQIAERLGVRRQTVLYHLQVLTYDGLVVSQVNGRRHYFRRDDPQRADSRHVLSPGTRSIFDTLPERPITAQELADRLGLSRRTVHWHLGRLRDHGLVLGLRSRAGIRYVRSGGAHHFRSV